jgi:hypothetical protein
MLLSCWENICFMKNLLIIAIAVSAIILTTLACKKNKPRTATYSCVCKFKSYYDGKDTSTETTYPASVNANKSLCDSSCLHTQYALMVHDTAATCKIY